MGGRPRVGSLGQVDFPRAFPSSRTISVLGRANWAGGRLRGPHTTVLTEGSERLSGPGLSVGWYCCKIEIQTRRPSAPRSGARAGRDGWAGRARPGGRWGALLPLTPSCSGASAWAGPLSRPSVRLSAGEGQSGAGGASQLSL